MGKIEEGQAILKALGLPPQQQTRIASYTLLALLGLEERDPWPKSRQRSLKIHDILGFIKRAFRKTYAENTRETVRRQVLHQLEQARVVDRNPDDPGLSTNSPRTHYAVTPDALRAIRAYSSGRFAAEADRFRQLHGSLAEAYGASRTQRMIPVTLPSGQGVHLSPGKHNRLQVSVITEFLAHFAPEARILYLGDTANKSLVVDRSILESLGVPVTAHDKLPDVVLYSAEKKRLYLVEAVTSHGPVSPKRFRELEGVLSRCMLRRVYVSAFPDFREFKRHLDDIAWETEVWLAETPSHMIHFNGESFLRS